jgi:hypothetical protein
VKVIQSNGERINHMGGRHRLHYPLQQRSYCLSCWTYYITTKHVIAIFSVYDTKISLFSVSIYSFTLFISVKYILYTTMTLLNTLVHKLRNRKLCWYFQSQWSKLKKIKHLCKLQISAMQILITKAMALSSRKHFYISTHHHLNSPITY